MRIEDRLHRAIRIVQGDGQLLRVGVATKIDGIVQLTDLDDPSRDLTYSSICIARRRPDDPINLDDRDRFVAIPLGQFC